MRYGLKFETTMVTVQPGVELITIRRVEEAS
jgi:hypothetical protein